MERREGEEIHITPEHGSAGGVAPAAAAWPAIGVDRIRWGAIWAGLLVAIATQMILSAFGLAIGLYSFTAATVGGVGGINWSAVGLWSAIWGLIALFLGGWTAARLASSPSLANGIWHGAIVWALTLVLGTLLAALGITGVLGFLPSRVLTTPGITTGDVINTSWGFFIGSLLGLGAAIWGGAVGRRRERTEEEARGA
ncbi:MAG: hypothetical protein GX774_06705 [Armatimonadetes bacterium]|jgi:hypothetical protein|nr:hypothetical protein [Armatimonadota bacterium]